MNDTTKLSEKEITLTLNKVEPTTFPVEKLQQQLYGIGLTCEQASIQNLEIYKQEVLDQLHSSNLQAYGIFKPANDFSEIAFQNGHLNDSEESYIDGALELMECAQGEWQPDNDAAGYLMELSVIQVPAHFKFLTENRAGFTGKTQTKHVSEKKSSVDAIKDFFIGIAKTAAQCINNDINRETLEAVFSNILSGLNEKNVDDFKLTDSRVIYLTLDTDGKNCAGVGVMNISYDILIKKYKKKHKEESHDTTIDICCRGVFYNDESVLMGDYIAVKNHFKKSRCLISHLSKPNLTFAVSEKTDIPANYTERIMVPDDFEGYVNTIMEIAVRNYKYNTIPVRIKTTKIFNTLPPANEDTFRNSLTLQPAQNETHIDAVVLYSTTMNLLQALDNSESDASISYTKSYSKGFTFGMTQSVSAGMEFQTNFIFSNNKFHFSIQLDFKEDWTTTVTETIGCNIGPRSKAYLYQGAVQASILRFDTDKMTFHYLGASHTGQYLTGIIKATSDPIF